MGRITGGEAILFLAVKQVFWFTDSRRSHPVFHHDHPKRTLFIIAVFLITSARFSLVVPRSKLFAHDKIATRISIETAESVPFVPFSPEIETLAVTENLVYQHASESQFYSQWTTGRVKFNKNVRDLRQPTGHPPFSSTEPRFLHGVASGDALSDRVIIWTKVSPPPETASFYVRYDISLSATEPDSSLPGSPFSKLETSIRSGVVLTGPEVDYTVKIDLTGLDPKTVYYFQFSAPSNIADHKYGKPHSLEWRIRRRELYWKNPEAGQRAIDLGDYRVTPSTKKMKTYSRSSIENRGFDHEFVDDISGFFNSAHSNETLIRIPAAMRAYFEYLPIRVQKNFHYKPAHLSLQSQNRDLAIEADQHNGIYRNFHFGKLLDS
ncbi:hypothetical protein BCR33DRAFT_783502 [Rhizoclosmatium globosum]|uniref:Uncharacterized protein n=1 Tax=Rhizoclosmatium globosum TaxID=329046 RepID=A0A1Y2CH39_9FUNG|nr:hypothetical protein BCR33DRAFT_783502 [Rhizoclosmatium globosum]|eukprot:ORY46322.1 hypothetical protein BCR33DRAFT_783502 [Rhizoclosmatium globosum]